MNSISLNYDKIISRFGNDFYRRLLQKLKEYPVKWQLENLEQIDYYSVNCLFTCTSRKYGDCVLKIGEPCKETRTEYEMLVEYAGTRYCRVYEADIDNGVLLIERIIPGTQLRAVSDINKRLDIFCEVYKGLHKQPTDKKKYPTYLGWVSRIAAFMREKKEYSALSVHMTAAEQICRELCEKYCDEMLLHGDLHHDNILLGSDNQYCIIDPKGVVGDCVFDIPRFVLNEFEDEMKEDFTIKYNFIIEMLSEKLHIPKTDLLKLVYVEMCMGNSWCVESNEAPNMKDVEFTKDMLLKGTQG
jgi:streptomycin 6-kinase